MIKITGGTCSDLCDPQLKMTRRDLLRVGGASMLGLSLGSLFKLQALAGEPGKRAGGPGWGTAKNVVMIYLQGGPSHLDLWGLRKSPDNTAARIPRRLGVNFTEVRLNSEGERQVHHDPLDELHAQRPVQPHRRHLPDRDRLHDRQSAPPASRTA